MRVSLLPRVTLLLGFLLVGACSGVYRVVEGEPGDPGPDGPGGPVGNKPDNLVDSTQYPRLSHVQWDNTVTDLLKLETPSVLSKTFTTDPPGSAFANNGALLKVTPGLFEDQAKAAESLADELAKSEPKRLKILPADFSGELNDKATKFVTVFGQRAFRRPLEKEEITNFVALFVGAAAITEDKDPIVAGIRLTVQAFLQSPAFVYRVEVGTPSTSGTGRTLTAWEVASKLSYALWNTMPDDILFKAAEDGSLSTPAVLEVQARRLLADPRAQPMMDDFHERFLKLDHIDVAAKDDTLHTLWSPTMPASMRQETTLFVRHIAFTKNEGLSSLLTTNEGFVNAELAQVYGLKGTFGKEFTKVTFDPKERAGLLTQGAFLAANAGRRETDPIHRGVFVNLNLICANLPPPPMMVPPLPSDAGAKTMRERVTAHTGKGTCGQGCHATMINPIGFAFEGYDAIGRMRTSEGGQPINAADTYKFEDGPQTYDGAISLSKVLSERMQVHRCYSKKWLEYVYGRFPDSGGLDDNLLERIGGLSLKGASIKELIVQYVLAKPFSLRPAGGS